jgi:co-chaperonin GroES (HSP10)
VFIDPGIFYHSRHGEDDRLQLTTNTISRKDGLYSIEPQNIVLYDNDGDWKGYSVNFIGKKIKEEFLKKSFLYMPENRDVTNMCEVIYVNSFLNENDIKKGDTLILEKDMGVSVWFDGVEYTWVRNNDVFGKKI